MGIEHAPSGKGEIQVDISEGGYYMVYAYDNEKHDSLWSICDLRGY